MEDKNNDRQVTYKKTDRRKLLIYTMFFITLVSLPGSVKCETGDAIASFILFLIISVFACAGIGWWSRRGDPKY